MLHADITDKIIKAYYKVYNTLGFGFLEKVYENALIIELKKVGFNVAQQQNIMIYYEGHEIGTYFTDIIINDLVILELKAVEKLCNEHKNQLINYLKATDKEIGLLFNFGRIPEFKRVIFTNDRKNITQ
ncbi:MAG: GxxExxY protein [Sedimentisphaerales bacterium]|nr:GxxExxY protein [Sedimentisphaerales bacterium]